MLHSLSIEFLLIYWYTKKIKFIEVLLERHRELTHESAKYAYVDTFTTYWQPCQMCSVSWCFCKLLCSSRERYSLSSLSQSLYSFLSHWLIFQWAWHVFCLSFAEVMVFARIGKKKFCESHRVQVVYTFFLTYLVAL